MSDCRKNDSGGSIVGGLIVLGVGLLFLGVNMDILPPVSESWPLFLVIVGVALIVGNLLKKKTADQNQEPPPPSH
jgi:hypothetical protein